MNQVRVRLAQGDDVSWYQTEDRTIPAGVIRRKIEALEVFVAELDGKRAGHLRLDFLWSKYPFIALIRVLPEFRRHGVGRALLAFVEAHLRAGGREVLYSSSMASEPEAQAWHRHLGFEECGILDGANPGGVGEIFFRKRLR
jgi:ribosomal protein S18 acetylase RimI-like enzyme